MEIALSKVLSIRNPRDFKIHFATWNGIKEPLDVFIQDLEEWKGWNSFRGSRDDFNRPFIFSLIRYYHQKDMWLFGGVFEVLERRPDRYVVRLLRTH